MGNPSWRLCRRLEPSIFGHRFFGHRVFQHKLFQHTGSRWTRSFNHECDDVEYYGSRIRSIEHSRLLSV